MAAYQSDKRRFEDFFFWANNKNALMWCEEFLLMPFNDDEANLTRYLASQPACLGECVCVYACMAECEVVSICMCGCVCACACVCVPKCEGVVCGPREPDKWCKPLFIIWKQKIQFQRNKRFFVSDDSLMFHFQIVISATFWWTWDLY